jgi:hypothetical protein
MPEAIFHLVVTFSFPSEGGKMGNKDSTEMDACLTTKQ